MIVPQPCRSAPSLSRTAYKYLEPILIITALSSPVCSLDGFDWSMPPRFGIDQNGDGLVDFIELTSEAAANPELRVDFTCDSTTVARQPASTSYLWKIDGIAVDLFLDETKWESADRCSGYYIFERQEPHLVELEIADLNLTFNRTVLPRDFLIVSLGDSYASGEGAPEVSKVDDAFVTAWRESAMESLQGMSNSAKILGLLEGCGLSNITTCTRHVFGVDHSISDGSCECIRNFGAALFEGLGLFKSTEGTLSSGVDLMAQFRNGTAKWQPEPKGRERCHRSLYSPHALAALEIEESDNKSTVSFVHASCSGATSKHVVDLQLPLVREVTGSREVDALLLSEGGNDVLVSIVFTACVFQEDCVVDETYSLSFLDGIVDAICDSADLILSAFPAFPAFPINCRTSLLRYLWHERPAKATHDMLLEEFEAFERTQKALTGEGEDNSHAQPPFVRQTTNRVFLTKNPESVFRSQSGEMCYGSLPGVSDQELDFLDSIGPQLNDVAEAFTAQNNWTFVGERDKGAADPNGICAHPSEFRHVNDLVESILIQGDVMGFFHLNKQGNKAVAGTLAEKLKSNLFPRGVARMPQSPPMVTIVGPTSILLNTTAAYTASVFDAEDDAYDIHWTVAGSSCIPVSGADEFQSGLHHFSIRSVHEGNCTISVSASDAYSGRGDAFETNVQVVG